MFNKFRKAILLLVAVVIGVVILAGIKGYTFKQQRIALIEKVTPKLNEEVFDVALVSVYNRDEMDMNSFIRWWRDPNDGKVYFFLPNSWKNNANAIWVFTNAEEIMLDDRVIRNGDVNDIDEGTYTLRVGTSEYCITIMYSADIASLFIENVSGGLEYIHEDKEYKEPADYMLYDRNGKVNNYGHISEFSSRGNVTFKFVENKKSYHMDLQEKSQILDMGKEKDWVLLANYFDHSLARNMIIFNIARELGLAYTPDMEYVDLYINGEYRGNYVLAEKVEVGSDRVNIRNLTKETELFNQGVDLSTCEQVIEQPGRLFSRKWWKIPNEPPNNDGGYLLELEWADRYGLDLSGFITSRMQAVVVHNPKYATLGQIGYISDAYQDFEDALYSENGYNEATGKYFYEYIDMESFALKYMLEELSKNLDASYTSCYIYKPEGEEIFYAGPVWDYDGSLGLDRDADNGMYLGTPEDLYVATQKKDTDIWYNLYSQPYFREYVYSLNESIFSECVQKSTETFIEDNARKVVKSVLMDDVLWERLEAEGLKDKEEEYYEINADIKLFLDERLDCLAEEWSCTLAE